MSLILVDGSGYIFRAYYALPPLTNSEKVPVGAVYGFCTMLQRLIERAENNKLLVVFDAGRKTFRQDIYPEYKANRPPAPDDLIPQFAIIKESCKAFGVPSVELTGFEADDLIASYANQALAIGEQVEIISADKDLMQLLRPGISMWDPLKNRLIDDKIVFEKFGVSPNKVIDVQALCGDSTDNIPGVPGIGPKTAAELIQTFESLENLLNSIEQIKQPRRRDLLNQNKELALISKQLVTLKIDTPLPIAIDNITPVNTNLDERDNFLKKHGFLNLLKRLNAPTNNATKTDYQTIHEKSQLEEFLKIAKQAGKLVIDCETTSLNAMQAKLVGIALAVPVDNAWKAGYLPIAHKTSETQMLLPELQSLLSPVLSSYGVLKIGHNLKYDLLVLENHGFDVVCMDDTMLMSYVLNAGLHNHGLDELALKYLNHRNITFEEVAGKGKSQKTFDYIDLKTATNYAAEDADITGRLWNLFSPALAEKQVKNVYEVAERPLIPVIVAMEKNGIIVDDKHLKNLGIEFLKEMQFLESEIHAIAGVNFNIASSKQLGEILFDKMQLQGAKKTKMGAYSTDADVLEKLAAQGIVIAEKVIKWRGLAKLNSTYVEGLLSAINTETGRVHTSYSMVGASTGRLSSSDPNLQNIPIKSADGKKIRQAFRAADSYILASLDYSQIELRLLSHFADVPTLREAFINGDDIHKITASEVFGVPLDEVNSELRRRAKTVNFGIIYGISAFGLAQQLGVSNQEASQIINAYFKRYPGIEAYMQSCKLLAKEQGFVATLLGRKLHIPGILDKNPMMRGFSERQAVNAPLQGSNADIIKKAMIAIKQYLNGKNTKLLLQVHDELVFEIPQAEVHETTQKLKSIMESVVTLKVPLVVDIGIGNNWDEAHG
jgi:DNA polymerase-1